MSNKIREREKEKTLNTTLSKQFIKPTETS